DPLGFADDISRRVALQCDEIAAGAVFGDDQRALHRAAESLVLIFNDAVRRNVRAEIPRRPAIVDIGVGAGGVGAEDFVGDTAGGGVAAVQNVFPARRVGMAVISALLNVV